MNAKIPSARNQQVLRFRPVLADEAPKVLPHIRLGGALPELHLPLPGTEPNAFIIICSTVAEDRYVDIDLGISAQSMLLQAVEIGLNLSLIHIGTTGNPTDCSRSRPDRSKSSSRPFPPSDLRMRFGVTSRSSMPRA